MSDRYVEKSFLYLLALSLLLHLGIYGILSLIPPGERSLEQKATMVDLTDLPELPDLAKPQAAPEQAESESKRRGAREPRVAREPALRPDRVPGPVPAKPARPTLPSIPSLPSMPGPAATSPPQPAAPAGRQAEAPRSQSEEPVSRGEGIFKPKGAPGIERAKLFPSAGRLAHLEESYRRKYGREVEKGETSFLNTEDIRFGSFLRRFETAVYGVWHYPEAALLRGIEGTTPVRITFNRSGEIVQVELLESSGSGILDDEVMRTLKTLGPIGSFPRGYSADTFKLIAFFQYGIGGGRLR